MTEIIIFTDGASRGNPGPGGWGAIIIFNNQVVELGGNEDKTTNNRMELSALLGAFSFINKNKLNDKELTVYTDSTYAVSGLTQWIINWKRNNWQTQAKADVLNKDIWQKLDIETENLKINWQLIKGHIGIYGNERADVIATAFADKKDISLFDGSLDDYDPRILNISKDHLSEAKRNRSKMKAYSYLSLVDGVFKKHQTWSECEKEVKGKKNTKFKKTISAEDELEIMKEWGV